MSTKQKLGLIIGRFQPLHNGHVGMIKTSLEDCEKTLILVGSSNRSLDHKNPLTTDQRVELLWEVLGSPSDNPGLLIKTLPDNPDNGMWIADVISRVVNVTDDGPPSEVNIYTSDKDKDFYESNFIYPVLSVASGELSATKIREYLYVSENPVKGLYADVPQETMELMDDICDTDLWKDLSKEYFSCKAGLAKATLAHAFNNPIEPVVHAAVIHKNQLLLVKRRSVRGNGQWAIPGGFLEKNESTKQGALRELFEETGVSLEGRNCAQLAFTVEENLDDLSVRTLGINYLFVVAEEETIDVFIDEKEVMEYKWVPMSDVLDETEVLFYNHNVVFQRLIGTWDMNNE